MSLEDLRKYYEQSTDDELAQILTDKQDLVPEAAEALDQEIKKRQLVMPEPRPWTRQPGSEECVESLEDYPEHRNLLERKKTFGRYWYLVAMGPFILGLALGKTLFENSMVLIVVTLFWAMCIAVYGLTLNARFLGFRCPQCSRGFGRGSECFNCGFPRSMKN